MANNIFLLVYGNSLFRNWYSGALVLSAFGAKCLNYCRNGNCYDNCIGRSRSFTYYSHACKSYCDRADNKQKACYSVKFSYDPALKEILSSYVCSS